MAAKKAAKKKQPEKAAPGGLDLGQVSAGLERQEEGHTIEVRGPDGRVLTWKDGDEEKPVTATFAGIYSERHQRAEREVRREQWKKQPPKEDQDPDDIDPDELVEAFRATEDRVVARCLLGWSGLFDAGEPLEPTPENCLAIMRAPFVRTQFVRAVGDTDGFFGPTSPGSSDG